MNALARALSESGSSFTPPAAQTDLDFTTPLARPGAVAADSPDIVVVRSHLGHAGNRVVLVVDGDEESGERAAAMLREAGYHAAVETSPREAARHMSRLGAPALVLLEAELPRMSGFDFLERMRASRHLKDTPVVLFAARAAHSDMARAFAAGADGYIAKSVDPATFVAAVRKLLGDEPG